MFQEPTKPQTFYTANPSSLELIRRFPAFAGPSGLEFGLLWIFYFGQIMKNGINPNLDASLSFRKKTLLQVQVSAMAPDEEKALLVKQPWCNETT